MIELTLQFDTSQNTLYFSVGADFFPEEGWIDLVSVDLGQWIPRLVSFFSEHTDSCRLDFMDGPFSVQLSRKKAGVTARFLEDNREALPEAAFDPIKLIQSVTQSLRAMNRTQYESGQKPMYSKELALLTQILRK